MSTAAVPRLRTDELAYAWMDGPRTPMQIGLLASLEAAPFLRDDGRLDVERVRAELAARARRVPELGRRVHWTRPHRARAEWVADAADPMTRIGATELPPDADLLRWAAVRTARPLDLDRPPWRMDVVDGLPGGRVGVLAVLHHLLADGLAAVSLVSRLLDGPAEPVRAPVPAEPLDASRAGLRRLAEVLADFRRPEPAVPLPTRIGSDRRLAVVHQPLREVQRSAHAFRVTVNDLLLAAVTSGLRDWLIGRGVDPAGLVLRTTVPAATGRPGQVMGLLVVGLPVGDADATQRLAAIHRATTAGKARLRAPGGDASGMRLPVPVGRAVLLAARSYGSRRVTLSVTDVPGPTAPLSLAGARLLEAVPIAPLVPHVPLSVAALSYAGDLCVSVNADGAVADVDVLADGIRSSLSGLPDLLRRTQPVAM